MLRRLRPLACSMTVGLPATALAQPPSGFTGFHSVLAFGEGQGTSAQDLAAFEANGTVPPADLNQAHQYEGLEQAWPGLTAANLPSYYKSSDFQPRPTPDALAGLLGRCGAPATRPPRIACS
jgi:hypothetical protein